MFAVRSMRLSWPNWIRSLSYPIWAGGVPGGYVDPVCHSDLSPAAPRPKAIQCRDGEADQRHAAVDDGDGGTLARRIRPGDVASQPRLTTGGCLSMPTTYAKGSRGFRDRKSEVRRTQSGKGGQWCDRGGRRKTVDSRHDGAGALARPDWADGARSDPRGGCG